MAKDIPQSLKRHPFYGFELDESQINFRDAIWDKNNLIVFANARAGSGKAQPVDTIIPTPDGEKRLGDIQVGDYVFDRLGNPTRVLGVYNQGLQRAYSVTLSDGRNTICAGEHLWTYIRNGDKKFITETLNSMMERSILCGKENCSARYNIPINHAVKYKKKNFSVSPYVVGVFIGDGSCTCNNLTLSSFDEEIVANVANDIGATYKRNSTKNYNWYFYKDGKIIKTTDIFGNLPSMLHTCDKKRIPVEYLYGDIEQRIELLQGILDTDGSIGLEKRYNVSYTTINKGLANDVLKLAYSLGFSASISIDKREWKYKTGVCYSIHFRIPSESKAKIFRLSRKLERANKSLLTDQKRNYEQLPIREIKDLGYECEMVCIYVDNPEHLYLTNDFIVTHNTLISFATANLLVEYGLYDGIVYVVFPCEESKQGYLPGDITQKSEVYFEPIYQAIIKCNIEPHRVINDESMTTKKAGDAYVKLLTSTYLRGTNFENKVVVIEEAQNGTADELKKVLTRCSDNCKVIVVGHTGQIDLQNKSKSGFAKYIEHFRDEQYCAVCELTTNHRGLVSTKADELIT